MFMVFTRANDRTLRNPENLGAQPGTPKLAHVPMLRTASALGAKVLTACEAVIACPPAHGMQILLPKVCVNPPSTTRKNLLVNAF